MRVSLRVGIENMEVQETQTGVKPSIEQRLNCLRESRLRECAQLALSATVELEAIDGTPIEARLQATVDDMLTLTTKARHVFESRLEKRKVKFDPWMSEDEVFALLEAAKAPHEYDAETQPILDKEPFSLGDKLNTDDESDRRFDAAAQQLLESLDGVEVTQQKRYRRYSIVVGLNHPQQDLQVAITRRAITPQEDNPIDQHHAERITDPHGVHYSITFEPIAKVV